MTGSAYSSPVTFSWGPSGRSVLYAVLFSDRNACFFQSLIYIHCDAKKSHHFIFCNNFVKTFYSEIIIG